MKVIYSLIIAVIISIGAAGMTNNIEEDLQSNIVRLHIIANDDTEKSQNIKLKVRDEIIKNVSLDDKDFIEKSEEIANQVLMNNGVKYKAKSQFGRFYFPLKQYKNITLPSGEYYGVRVILGNGAGHNWWCIMYPPMCVVNDTEMEMIKKSSTMLKNNIGDDTYEIIAKNDNKIKIKFKTIEIINKLKHH